MDVVRGLKAGIVAGVIFWPISTIANFFLQMQFANSQVLYYSENYYVFALLFSIPTSIIIGGILGAILGLLYGAVYDKLPGSSSIVKALMIALMIWLIFSLGFGYLTSSLSSSSSRTFETNLISGLILDIFFGVLLGMCWDRMKGNETFCPNCQKNIPYGTRVCPTCGITIITPTSVQPVPPAPSTKTFSLVIAIVIGVTIIVVIAAAFTAYFFISSFASHYTPIDTFMTDDYTTIHVSSDGSISGSYRTIAEGIAAAGTGDTVYVHSGIYYERLTLTKSITLRGENKYTTIIDGQQQGSIITVTHQNSTYETTTISGFTIQHSGIDLSSGIYLQSGYVTISGNIIENNTNGVRINSYSSSADIYQVSLSSNIIVNNTFAGIEGYRVHSAYIQYNTFHLNRDAISLQSSSIYNQIYQNTITNNQGNGIYLMFHCSSNTITYNVLNNNSQGIILQISCNMNTISHNNISQNLWGGMMIQDSSYNYVTQNILSENSGGSGIYLYLSASNNSLIDNTCADNKCGIRLYPNQMTSANKIYHNDFIDNSENTNSTSNPYNNASVGINQWDDNYKGNYWSDYQIRYPEASALYSVWNLPYIIFGTTNEDRYPLLEPYPDTNRGVQRTLIIVQPYP